MPRREKKRDVTFYLLKEGSRSIQEELSPDETVTITALTEAAEQSLTLVTRPPRSNEPWWAAFIRQGFQDLDEMYNANTAALLFISVDNRRFAITFGYGRNLLALDVVERGFGLKVALNVIDPQTLRSVDARTFEDVTVAKRTQTSQAASLESFGLRVAEEILRAVTGKPRDSSFGARVTGGDALKITYTPLFSGLSQKCSDLLRAYQLDTYKEEFGFIDHLREVRDSQKIQDLDNALIDKLTNGDFEGVHLAPPDVADWSDIDAFAYSVNRSRQFDALEMSDYLALLGAERVSLEKMKRHKVATLFSGGSEPLDKWSVYDAVVCEVRNEDDLYILSGGNWYSVEPDFARQLANDVERYANASVILPAAITGEHEDIYNARAARENHLHLFDQKTVRPEGSRSGIEFCDLMTGDQKLIHVKRKSRSSTLSHLFAQGAVSGELFFADQTFRERLKEKALQEVSATAADLIPYARPTPSAWEIVYAVIVRNRGQWPHSLPFFSQLNFRNAANRLERLGFKVSLMRVDV